MSNDDKGFRVDERLECGEGSELVTIMNRAGEGWPFMLNLGEPDARGCACPRCAPHEQVEDQSFPRFIGYSGHTASEAPGRAVCPTDAGEADVSQRNPNQQATEPGPPAESED